MSQLKENRKQKKGISFKRIALAAVVLTSVIALMLTFGCGKRESDVESQYQQGVQELLDEDYAAAEQTLSGVSVHDAQALLGYAQIRANLGRYSGRAEDLLGDLQALDTFENTEIEWRKQNTIEAVMSALEVQDEIDQIDPAKISVGSKTRLNKIQKSLDNLQTEYAALLRTETLEAAFAQEEELERKAAEEAAAAAAELQTLTETQTMQTPEAERQTPQQSSQNTWNDVTVYITPTGECYHRDGCRTTKNSNVTPLTRGEAAALGYRPCGVCEPG